ncbi:MAG: bifunctional oligoribonuclease/PAP phosphatase NrnA [Patescibacteria group bacterium]|nr:bifunctional oligoribonuclease/PAP phosphatase NrnA [Patescibacteria group bacterium]
MNDRTELLKCFAGSRKNVLTLHHRPDGDSVGSNCAFAEALRLRGHSVDIFSIDTVPEYLMFIPGADTVRVQPPEKIPWHRYDTYWALDMASPDMIGIKPEFPDSLTVAVLDHHVSNKGWGTLNLIEPTEISAASIVYSFLKDTGISISRDIATALMTGLCTDSGFFRYITSGAPLQVAAELIDQYGVDYQKIVSAIQSQLNIEDILFLGNALSLMKVDYERKVAYLPIPYQSWLNFGEAGQNSHLLTGYLQSINGTEFGVLVIEEKPGTFRLQFRSRNRAYDVSALAQKLGGGGHKNASGATIQAPSIDAAISSILSLA